MKNLKYQHSSSVVNRALPFLHAGSIEITLTVPFIGVYHLEQKSFRSSDYLDL